ncbi:guanylate kinase [Hyphomicrobium sp.]|uniref:guanylate kinase n=1 Tax=Hyphomicrobium sp. TaxID=82 RepID=UPI003F707026
MTTENPSIERRGLLLVLSSPSGAGKTSLARALLESDRDIALSISVTTRTPRPGEVDGRDYWFVDEARFKALRDADQLLEWATVFGNFYGTPRAPIEKAVAEGRDVLFDIDWQGTQQLSERMAGDLVRVFVLPPSGGALEARLQQRAQDPQDVVAKRMAKAASEISHWAEYDYVIVNGDLTTSIAGLKGILAAERLRRDRMTGLSSFVRGLQSALE